MYTLSKKVGFVWLLLFCNSHDGSVYISAQSTFTPTVTPGFMLLEQPAIFYPYGPAEGDKKAPVNDDGSTGEVPISTSFPYFDNYHDVIYVSTNGVLSFLTDVSQYTPDSFPLGGDRRVIAPFWADVDTRNGGRVFYRETNDADILTRATSDVQQAFPDQVNFQATWVFIATWHMVGFYGSSPSHPSKNSFQAVLITNGRHSFTIFNYGDIMWTTGTLSGGNRDGLGGTPAQAGFNAGDQLRFFNVPGSRTPRMLNIENTTNVGTPGRWVFRIDSAEVVGGGCNTAGSLTVGPRFGSLLGGYEVTLAGPCLEMDDDVTCRFDNVEVSGRVLDRVRVACVVPLILERMGRIPLYLAVNGNFSHVGVFTLVSATPLVNLSANVQWKAGDSPLSLSWDSSKINTSSVDIDLVAFQAVGNRSLTQVIPLVAAAPNNGTTLLPGRLLNPDPLYWVDVGAIRIRKAGSVTALNVTAIWSEVHTTDWYMNLFVYEFILARQASSRKKRESPLKLETFLAVRHKRGLFDLLEDIWDGAVDIVEDIVQGVEGIVDDVIDHINDIKESIFEDLCDAWAAKEARDPPNFDVIPCPCDTDQMSVHLGNEFETDPGCNPGNQEGCAIFHNGSYQCFRSSEPSPSGAGQQCCYNRDGDILPFNQGGGTYDRAHYKGAYDVNAGASAGAGTGIGPSGIFIDFSINVQFDVTIQKIPYVSHFLEDVVPYYYCCKLSTANCHKYSNFRPSDDCTKYVPPRPARTAGDPHFITLDGKRYTFNGLGEFHIIIINNTFLLQGRTQQVDDSTGSAVKATVWTAFVMKSLSPVSDTVQVQLGGTQPSQVLINGMVEEFGSMSEQTFTGVRVKMSQDGATVDVTFSSGIYVQITVVESDAMNFLAVLPDTFREQSRGLLGNFDGDEDNDFWTPSGEMIDVNSSLYDIHYKFGLLWMTSADETLFTYRTGTNHAMFQDASFVPIFDLGATAEQQKAAEGVCGTEAPECIYDYIATNRTSVAVATRQSIELYEKILNNTEAVLTCGFLPTPKDGYQDFKNSREGATVKFSCMSGFTLQGSEERVCQASGEWSGTEARCVESSSETTAATTTKSATPGTSHCPFSPVFLLCGMSAAVINMRHGI